MNIYTGITIDQFVISCFKDKNRNKLLNKTNLSKYEKWFLDSKHIGVRNNSKHKSYYYSWYGSFLNWYNYIRTTPNHLGVPKAVKNNHRKTADKNLVLAA